jgi:hypothetical protein
MSTPIAHSGGASRHAIPGIDSRDAVLLEARDVIRAIVGKEKRITLREDDFRARNQDGLDLCGVIFAKFAAALDAPRADGGALRKPRDFAARLAYNEINEERRGRGDTATTYRKLHDRFRYLIEARTDTFASWDDADGRKLVGLVADRSKDPASSEAIAAIIRNPAALGLAPIRVDIGAVKPALAGKVAEAVFRHLGRPVVIHDLVKLAAAALGLELDDARQESLDDVGAAEAIGYGPGPSTMVRTKEVLETVWNTLLDLELRHRRAYLLNCASSGLEVQDLVQYHVASIAQIGRSLELTEVEFGKLWSALRVDERRVAVAHDYDARFQIVWAQLPLKDKVIGAMMGVSELTVSNFREQARHALRAALATFWSH